MRGSASTTSTFPGSGCVLNDKLGMNGKPALDVRNQCCGFIYALACADGFVQTGLFKNILVVGAEVHSTALEFNDRGRDVAVLFGDGAGAAVVGPATKDSQGLLSMCLHADGAGLKDLWCEAPASAYDPRITHAMIDEGRHYPKMIGKHVFRWAIDKMPEVAIEAVRRAGLSMQDIDLFIPHQANMRINQMVAARLELPDEKVVHNIEKYGNTTAATIPMALDRAYKDGRVKDGSTLLFAAFGAGYTWAGAVLRI
jgi:3-oxoacyl-[acyl-carrier-protein] synthase III